MKIPSDAIISPEKLTRYLLVFRNKDDKSRFLRRGGFTLENPDALETAIRNLISENQALEDRRDEFGIYYRVEGLLVGVNGIALGVITVWIMRSDEDHLYRFVTLKPMR